MRTIIGDYYYHIYGWPYNVLNKIYANIAVTKLYVYYTCMKINDILNKGKDLNWVDYFNKVICQNSLSL
jgi:hypothetical protein